MSLSVSSEIYGEQKVNASRLELKLKNFPANGEGEIDEEGDLILSRKEVFIVLDVDQSTLLKGVGLQLWRGAFILSDYIIYHRADILIGKRVLELGTGVGLTSIIASAFAQQVTATDIGECGIIERIKKNFENNSSLVKSGVDVTELNFLNRDWPSSLAQAVTDADTILAADVIYDNDVTEAFADTLAHILSTSKKTALIALEKRYVFTIEELDTVAPCFEHFLNYLKQTWNKEPMSSWTIELVDLNFPKYFDYDRNRHLILWKICS